MPLNDNDVDEKIMADIDAGKLPTLDISRTVVHKNINNPDRLHQIAEQSHQDHKDSTGQVPDEDQGYTTYEHQGPYYKPSKD
jgi:hypothetical protein